MSRHLRNLTRNIANAAPMALFVSLFVFLGFILPVLLQAPPAQAEGPGCVGSWSIGIGGFNDNASMTFAGQVNQTVGYNSWDPASGVREIDRLFWNHRNECPGDHIKILGHSEGAGLVHAWVTDHQWAENANAVLLADPKRFAPGNGGPGMGALSPALGGFPGAPLAGVDDWFGGFPVLTICRQDDWVCNLDAPWFQSHFTGSHGWYNYNSWAYGDWDSGVWMV